MALVTGNKFNVSLITDILNILSRKQRIRLSIFGVQSFLVNLLDILAVGLLGVLVTVLVATQTDVSDLSLETNLNKFFNFGDTADSQKLFLFSLLVTFFFVLKSILSILLNKKLYKLLSEDMNRTGRKLAVDSILGNKLNHNFSLISRSQTLTDGLESIFFGVLASFILLCSDIALIAVLLVAIAIFSPLTALSLLFCFGFIGFTLFFGIGNKSQSVGKELHSSRTKLGDLILFSLNSRKEIAVAGKTNDFVKQYSSLEVSFHTQLSRAYFLPNLAKYLFEASLIVGMLVVGLFQFIFLDRASAVTSIFLFVIASLRIAPAVLRLQQSWLQIKHHSDLASTTLTEFNQLPRDEDTDPISNIENKSEFLPRIEVKNLSFRYSGRDDEFSVDNLIVESGKFVALIGPSGGGKTTFVDLVLGLLTPDSGEVRISWVSPMEAARKWPREIAYVPQDVFLMKGNLRQNVTLFEDSVDDSRLTEALRAVGLQDISEVTIDPVSIGEESLQLSGGQIQRIGIARALYQNPKLLVLDEATSSLDSESEVLITNLIKELKGRVTVLVIAHRLSTIQSADEVAYIDSGRVVAIGKFEELRAQIPSLEKQARILGL
jgi:ABC-type multidrug transport system fused ATPase/permease subunit